MSKAVKRPTGCLVTLVYEQAWTCACGAENVRRFTCAACSRMRPPESMAVDSPPPPSAAAVAATVRTHTAVSKNLARAGLAVVGILMALGVFGGFHAYQQHGAEQRLKAFANGTKGAEFVASDLQFRATFPKLPVREASTTDILGVHVPYTMYTTAVGDDDAFAVFAYDVAAGTPFDLNAGINGSAIGSGGHLESSTPTTFLGEPAIDAVLKAEGHYVEELLFRKGDHVWLLLVASKTNPPAGYDAFVASFSFL